MDAWINLVSTCGVGTILAWYLWYTTTTTIPRLQDEFQKSLDGVVAKFGSELDAERQAREPLHSSVRQLCRILRRRPCLREQAPQPKAETP